MTPSQLLQIRDALDAALPAARFQLSEVRTWFPGEKSNELVALSVVEKIESALSLLSAAEGEDQANVELSDESIDRVLLMFVWHKDATLMQRHATIVGGQRRLFRELITGKGK